MPTKKTTKQPQYDWGQEANTGFENTSAEDFGIPFLQIIQKGSPEYDESHKDHEKKHIKGIKPGMIINSQTREILHDLKTPIQFIPCYAEKMYPEFKPRKENGGFVQMHDSKILARTQRNDKNVDVIVDGPGKGNEVITTHYIFGHVMSKDGSWDRAVIGMTSTQLKNARRWLNMMAAIKQNGHPLPMFSHIYNVQTVGESNSEGSWFGWDMSVNRMLNPAGKDSAIVDASRQATRDSIKSSMLKLEDKQAESEAEPF